MTVLAEYILGSNFSNKKKRKLLDRVRRAGDYAEISWIANNLDDGIIYWSETREGDNWWGRVHDNINNGYRASEVYPYL